MYKAVTDKVSGAVAVSYAKAEYERYTNGSCHFGRVPDNADGSACILSGSTLPFAPRWKTSARVMYERPTSYGELFGRVDWAWVDSFHTNTSLDPRHVQGAYSFVNLRAGLRFESFEIALWINNATDETYITQEGPANMFPQDPAFGRFLGAPRSYGVTVRTR